MTRKVRLTKLRVHGTTRVFVPLVAFGMIAYSITGIFRQMVLPQCED